MRMRLWDEGDEGYFLEAGGSGGGGVASGVFNASAAALVPGLEASPLLGRVDFGAPVVRDPVSGAERFQFVIDLAPWR
mgnify:CR=1 FL=1